jgi:glycosyltransferase involved in cell wall biosynthesis
LDNPKHIALVVYYWPPSGGSGVQRWLFFANYFAENGLKVTVFTPKTPRIAERDDALITKVNKNINIIYVTGWEPLQKNKKPIGENLGSPKGMKSKLMRYVRANFFIPDARVFWVKAATKSFLKQHTKTAFDVLITTGPPHSLHLVGLKAKAHHDIKWIADFRDPWVGFFQNQSLPMTRAAMSAHEDLQCRVLKKADRVVVTAPSLAEEFKEFNKRITVLTNGYEKMFNSSATNTNALVYAGSLKAQQNPSCLWQAIQELTQESKSFAAQFSLEIYGNVAANIRQEVSDFGIEKWVKFFGYQSKAQLDKRLPSAKALLLLGIDMSNTHNIIHGKLFEYMAANRPVLGVGPIPSDMESLFEVHQLGVYTRFEDKERIKSTLLHWFTSDSIPFQSNQIDQYQRKEIANKYANLILKDS